MRKLNQEEYKELVKSRQGQSLQTINYDAAIVRFKKDEHGNDLPIVEEAYLVSDLLGSLGSKK